MKRKQLSIDLVIIITSSLIGLLLCEVGVRFVLKPGDYLSVSMVKHNILGGVVEPGAAGFDQWGFRNQVVPTSVDIVTIGDSHTYGNTARMVESWPYVLGKLTGKSVYNMGLGGYGPNQYYYLFETKVGSLKPKFILCGLYMGDDFENAFSITYGLEYWSYLRKENFKEVNPYIWENTLEPRWHKRIRIWFSRNSVLYQLAFHGPLLGKMKGSIQIEHASRIYEDTVSLILPDRNIREVFRPGSLLSRLDQEDKRIKEGMRITFALLKAMNERCIENRIKFIVVIIPTKELVFQDYLEQDISLSGFQIVRTLLKNEGLARESVFQFFKDSNIRYVDTLPALKENAIKGLYTKSANDMHPNRNGYRVIADAVYRSIKDMEVQN